jgi:hypothetical protein
MIKTLLTAFALDSPHSARSRLIIIGSGPLDAQLCSRCEQLGIASTTTFIPFVPHNQLKWCYRPPT